MLTLLADSKSKFINAFLVKFIKIRIFCDISTKKSLDIIFNYQNAIKLAYFLKFSLNILI